MLIIENNIQLRSQLVVFEEDNKRLKEKLATVELTSQNGQNEKLALEQENERLYIRVQDLESRYQIFHNELVQSDKEKQNQLEELSNVKYRKQELDVKNSKLEFDIKKLEQKMEAQRVESKIYAEEMLENLKITYKKKERLLEEKLLELTEKYNDKKLNSVRTRMALEQLRNHFMLSCSSKYENDDRIEDNLII